MTQTLDRFKFRYFDKISGFMGEVIYLNIKDDYLLVRFSYADEYTPDEEVFDFSKRGVLMQCTGLKDKNNLTLIYEGDILFEKNNKKRYIIVWDDGCFARKEINCKFEALWELRVDTKKDYKVIGNIYENKDLIL